MQSEYLDYDAIGLAKLVRSGQVSARELIDAAIARAEAVNPALNAIVLKDYQAARNRASRGGRDGSSTLGEGPLAGVPYLIKDLGAPVAGLRMSMGCRHFQHFTPTEDSLIVARSKQAGLNIFGKTNTPEIGQMPYTEPELFGPARNPWGLDYTPGGSSGGAAAAVAGGVVPLAHAADGGGSIRIPASCCGLFGYKPSNDVQPQPLPAPGDLAVDHAVSRSVRDSALLLDLTSSGQPGAFFRAVGEPCGPLRIGYMEEPQLAESLSADVKAALNDAARLAESLGHRVEPASFGLDFNVLAHAFLVMWSVLAEEIVLHADRISGQKPKRADFEIASWAMARVGQKIGERDLPAALETQRQFKAKMATLMTRYDVLLTPTLAAAPFKIGAKQPSQFERFQMHVLSAFPVEPLLQRMLSVSAKKAFDWAGCTELFNFTGQPAMSVPLYWNARGMPIGVQFAGRMNDDATLFRLAAQLEAARAWFTRRPALIAAR
ncbi:6-aminohexanoate-cyclic-dimer hydrolase [Caballeronia sp. SBC1]|uniref:amidase n=1 Tax=Caballeronia sp. SBC1 TaxID=2705548 RepID=UPI001408809E|nr:amidase [Caballeronia sp. SBC1]QIN60146.1 6-aminohexanoate-cyclic-dimer hydrolase [Caballeronia sp. SBC1]